MISLLSLAEIIPLKKTTVSAEKWGLGIVVLSNFNPAVRLCPRGDVGVD
jgi:hypothetical protein